MKLFKRIILICLCVLLAFGAFGCSALKKSMGMEKPGGDPGDDEPANPDNRPYGGTLKVLHYKAEDQKFYDWFNQKFERRYNCTVQYDSAATDGWGELVQGKLQGNSVDVFGIYPGSVYRDDATLPYMMDLSDMDFVNKLTDEYLAYATYTDGKVYSAPVSMVSNTVFYNKDIFAAYNLTVPTNYAEFIAVCDALKAKSADYGNKGNKVNGKELKAPIVFGAREKWPLSMTFNSIEAAVVRTKEPEHYVDIFYRKTKTYDNALQLEAFEKFKKISSYWQVNPFGISYTRIPGKFALGEYAMCIDGAWSYPQILTAAKAAEYNLNIGAFPLPANNSSDYKDYTVGKPGVGFAIHKNTAKAELAKLYIEYLYSDDVYAEYLKQTLTGSVLKGVDNPEDEHGMMTQMYGSKTYISPLSEYIVSAMPYPHDALEQIAINGKTAKYGVDWMTTEYGKVSSQVESLLPRWMALYNKGVTVE